MPEAVDVYGSVFRDGTITNMARVLGNDGTAIVQATISSAEYSVYLLNDQDPDEWDSISGHDAESLVVADIIFDTLQTDDLWEVDDEGYNFRHVVEVDTHAAFEIAGRNYLVEYTLTPASGQVIILRFRPRCI